MNVFISSIIEKPFRNDCIATDSETKVNSERQKEDIGNLNHYIYTLNDFENAP